MSMSVESMIIHEKERIHMIQVVAKKFIKEGFAEDFIETARELVELTRKEEGCIRYDLCQDTSTPEIISFIEAWESADHLKAHMQTDHFLRLVPLLATYSEVEGELNIYENLFD